MSKRVLVTLCILAAAATMFVGLTPMIAEQDTIYRTYGPLVEIDTLIKRHYVEEIDDARLVEAAIGGMLGKLDRFSAYIPPRQMDAFRRRHAREYIGIGIETALVDGEIVVIAPIENGPAAQAGIACGDVIEAVNDIPLGPTDYEKSGALLAGEPQSKVTLSIRRGDGQRTRKSVTRMPVEKILIKGVRHDAADQWDLIIQNSPRIAYLRIAHFSNGMAERVAEAVARQTGITGIIFDLRFNPGGVMQESLALIDQFVENGVLLTTVTRRKAVDTWVANGRGDVKIPIAVLINGASASSAEIVAGALQDHGRAIVVGERSFGKGSVQGFFELHGNAGGVKITIAHYQLPGGRSIHRNKANRETGDWGVLPDIVVPLSDEAYARIRADRARLDRHEIDAIPIDQQLRAALNALKARSGAPSPETPSAPGSAGLALDPPSM